MTIKCHTQKPRSIAAIIHPFFLQCSSSIFQQWWGERCCFWWFLFLSYHHHYLKVSEKENNLLQKILKTLLLLEFHQNLRNCKFWTVHCWYYQLYFMYFFKHSVCQEWLCTWKSHWIFSTSWQSRHILASVLSWKYRVKWKSWTLTLLWSC